MQTNITEKLAHKVAEILHNYNTMKNENEQLRLEIITLQAEREIKNQEIQRLNDQNTMKDMEIEEIVNNIESMLGSNQMSKKISLRIGSVLYDMDVEEPFYTYLSEQLTEDFNTSGNNELKALLKAYVKKTHELFIQEEKINEMLEKLEQKD